MKQSTKETICACGKRSYGSRREAGEGKSHVPGGRNLYIHACRKVQGVFHLTRKKAVPKRKLMKPLVMRPQVPCTHGNDVFDCPDCKRVRERLGMMKK